MDVPSVMPWKMKRKPLKKTAQTSERPMESLKVHLCSALGDRVGVDGCGPHRGTRRGARNTGSHHRVSVTGLVAGDVPDRAARAGQGGSHTL